MELPELAAVGEQAGAGALSLMTEQALRGRLSLSRRIDLALDQEPAAAKLALRMR